MIITETNIVRDLAIAPPINTIDLREITIQKTGNYKIDVINYVGNVKYGAAGAMITNTTVGVGSTSFDKSFEIYVYKNSLLENSIRVDGIGGWTYNPLYVNLNRFDSLGLKIRVYSVIGELEFNIESISISIEYNVLGYSVIQPQLINLENACICDKIGIGSEFSVQLRTPKVFEKEANLITNSSFNPNDNSTGWTLNGGAGVPMGGREMVLLTDASPTVNSALQTVAITKGTYFLSFNTFMQLNNSEVLNDSFYVNYKVYVVDLTSFQLLLEVELDKLSTSNDNQWHNHNYEFEAPNTGNITIRLELDSNVSDRIENFGFDDIYLHEITTDSTATITTIDIIDCDGERELTCEEIRAGNGDYNNDYNDDYWIEADEEEPCTIKEITYVDFQTTFVQAIINIENPLSGEFQYKITDSEGNIFLTPIFFIPDLDCGGLVKLSNFNNNDFIITSEASVNEYYLRGYIGTTMPIDAERVSYEQSNGDVLGTYYRGYKQAELTIGVYSGDAHTFFDRYLSIGNLQVNDKDFVIDKGAKYEINDLNNGTGVGKLTLTYASSGFVTLN